MPDTPLDSAINKLNNKSAEMLQQYTLAFLISLVRPLATVTEKLYRQQMGERYFTGWNVLIGEALILLASVPPTFYAYGFRIAYLDRLPARDWVSLGIGGIWALWFLINSMTHSREVRHRYQQGIVWHSYCYGIGFDGNPRALPIALLCIGIALVVTSHSLGWSLYGIGALLAFSGLTSAHLRSIEISNTHRMILDTIDRQIEQKNLAETVAKRHKPSQSEGLVATPPAFVSEKYREKFVAAINPKE